jgi:hypothetical protein
MKRIPQQKLAPATAGGLSGSHWPARLTAFDVHQRGFSIDAIEFDKIMSSRMLLTFAMLMLLIGLFILCAALVRFVEGVISPVDTHE